MKFITATVALSGVVAASCSTKSGQLDIISPLTAAWKLYNKEVAFNAAVDLEIANVNASLIGREQVITLEDQQLNQTVINNHASAVSAVSTGYTTKVADIGATFTGRNSSIHASHVSEHKTATGRHNNKMSRANLKLSAHNTSLSQATTAAGIESDQIRTAASILSTQANDTAKAAITAVEVSKVDKLAHTDDRVAINIGKYDNKKSSDLVTLNKTYTNIQSDLESQKLDVVTTLDLLDTTAGGDGLDYPSDCLVDVQDAIEMVKDGHSANFIWKAIVIDGGYSGPDPTPEPTDAPTTLPPTFTPTKAPTDAPTQFPTGDLIDAFHEVGCVNENPDTSYWTDTLVHASSIADSMMTYCVLTRDQTGVPVLHYTKCCGTDQSCLQGSITCEKICSIGGVALRYPPGFGPPNC